MKYEVQEGINAISYGNLNNTIFSNILNNVSYLIQFYLKIVTKILKLTISVQRNLVSSFVAYICWYLLRYVSKGIQFSKSSVGDKSSQILSAEWPSGNLLWSPHFFSISTQSDLQINKQTKLHEHHLKKKKGLILIFFPFSNPHLSSGYTYVYICMHVYVCI